MKVVIITHTPFPEGLAPTNRVFYHAKGLQDNHVEVKVIIALPTEKFNNVKNPVAVGVYKGIEFEYSLRKTERSKHFLRRRFDDFIGPVKAGIKAIREKPDAVLMISYSSIYVLCVLKLIFLISGKTFIVEETEFPLFGKKDNGVFRLRNKFLKKFLYKNLDGFLVISHELKKRYSKLVSKKCPVVLIPVIVDVSDIYDASVERTRNLVYTGPLVQKKDGILTILKSFSSIAEKFPEVKLVCTGNVNISPDKERVLSEIQNCEYKDRIVMTGFISREKMIEYLNSACGLVLAKPSSEQADTCFPTKLGEYLSTGNPIVVTKTGEIPLYLQDGTDAYIAEPDSVESFTQKLMELLSNPEKAAAIGLKGRETAMKHFNYKEISKKVINLIGDLQN
ncbi:MAG: glycosyltransferase family 4 protein [Candidatus Delongbacteria bacterium]